MLLSDNNNNNNENLYKMESRDVFDDDYKIKIIFNNNKIKFSKKCFYLFILLSKSN